MPELASPINILSALKRLRHELVTYLGLDVYAQMSSNFDAKLAALQASHNIEEQETLADELQDMLLPYEPARERLLVELYIQAAMFNDLENDLITIAEQLGENTESLTASIVAVTYTTAWQIPSQNIPKSQEIQTKSITLKPGIEGTKSIKFSNISLDFSQASQIVAGVLLNSLAILDRPHPFIIAAGFLNLIGALQNAMTVQLSIRDASVFWGFIQKCDNDKHASESIIFNSTNKERKKYGLKLLDRVEFRNALVNLEALKSIAPVQGKPKTWLIIEKYRIKA
jgi:uncharacterized protein YkwD